MAFRISNPNTNNTIPSQRIAVGVSIPFNNRSAFNSTYTNIAQLRSNIINFLLTNNGERVLNPTFGAGLEQFIAEAITQENLDSLKENITASLRSAFPGVTVTNVTVTPNYDYNSVTILISILVAGEPTQIQISV
jgi:phage baseplate assembly protein W